MPADREVARRYAIGWLRNVLPELAETPVYIIGLDEAPELWRPIGAGAHAHVTFDEDPMVRDHLQRHGLWQGPGFVFMYHWRMPGGDSPVRLRNLAAHEYVHHVLQRALEREAPPAVTPGPVAEPEPEPETAEDLAAVWRAYGTVLEWRPWYDHDAPFIRLMIHIWARSERAQRPLLGFDVLAAGAQYGLSPIREYRTVLGNEPAELAYLPLVDVARIPVSAGFRDFFDFDSARYRNQRKTGC